MAASKIPQRSRTPDDDVLSTSAAAEALGQRRQAVDQAARKGNIEAFQDPSTRRIWISRNAVRERLGRGPLADLEARVTALENALSVGTTSTGELSNLRAENATLRQVNVLLLAAAADHQLVDRHRQRAARKLRKALKTEQQANDLAQSVLRNYRDALAQTQLPSQPSDATT